MNTSSGAPSPFDNSQPTADLSASTGTSKSDDPNATQLLPVTRTAGSGRLPGADSVLGGLQSGTAAPVGSNVFDPPDDTNTNPPTVPRAVSTPQSTSTGRLSLLPMPTRIGLAAVVGALIVVLVPALMRRLIPTVPMKQFPAETVVRDPSLPPVAMPPSSTIIEKPLAQTAVESGNEPAAIGDKPATNQSPGGNAPDETGLATADSAPEGPIADEPNIVTDNTEKRPDSASNEPRVENRERFSVTERKRDSPQNQSNGSRQAEAWVHPRTGYAISPPAGFKRQRTGRRTIWRGPGGAQLLVETTNAPGASARADWERLDAALAKKYGRNYRSLGIRETELAGRPAAVWEFEISSKRGTTRKIDVAVHERGRGYAVLAEAPASRFDEMRPQLEAAIASFQPPDKDKVRDAAPSRSTSRGQRRSESRKTQDDETPKARAESREDDEAFSAPGY